MSVSILIAMSTILLFCGFNRSVERKVHDAAGALEAEARPGALKHLHPDGTFE